MRKGVSDPHEPSFSVFVAAADPVGAASAFIPALRHQGQVMVVEVHHVVAPVVAGVGVKDGAACVFVEDAVSLALGSFWILYFEVVERFLLGKLLGGKRDVIVEIEICIAG